MKDGICSEVAGQALSRLPVETLGTRFQSSGTCAGPYASPSLQDAQTGTASNRVGAPEGSASPAQHRHIQSR